MVLPNTVEWKAVLPRFVIDELDTLSAEMGVDRKTALILVLTQSFKAIHSGQLPGLEDFGRRTKNNLRVLTPK